MAETSLEKRTPIVEEEDEHHDASPSSSFSTESQGTSVSTVYGTQEPALASYNNNTTNTTTSPMDTSNNEDPPAAAAPAEITTTNSSLEQSAATFANNHTNASNMNTNTVDEDAAMVDIDNHDSSSSSATSSGTSGSGTSGSGSSSTSSSTSSTSSSASGANNANNPSGAGNDDNKSPRNSGSEPEDDSSDDEAQPSRVRRPKKKEEDEKATAENGSRLVAAAAAAVASTPDAVESAKSAVPATPKSLSRQPSGVTSSSAARTPTPSKKAARVNARGMWRHWTLLFKTPLLAMHDLLDNCVDATQLQTDGRIYVDVDATSQLPGIRIMNNSIDPIEKLEEILSPYASKKDGDADTIGQSGVGLKQSSATLSDLNFVLVRNKDTYELGFIARALQPEVGEVALPSFKLEVSTRHELQELLDSIFQENPDIGDCVRHYGNGELEAGRDQLLHHFMDMSSDETGWGAYDHVFTLLIADFKHRHSDGEDSSSSSDEEGGTGGGEANMGPVEKFLYDVKKDMPKRYLSIPLDVRVSNQAMSFNYWQTRLVELTQFDLPIHKKKSIVKDPFFKTPPINTEDAYKLRVYAGFDPIRLADEKESHFLSLFIYSRKSGRLIEMKEDARNDMGITAGGTEYSQGLTVIVDDYDGDLKLNPAKTEVTFGQEVHGQTHSKNLYAWLSVATRLYYDYCKHTFCGTAGGEKGQLTSGIRAMQAEVYNLIRSNHPSLSKPMHECAFSRFTEIAASVSAKTGKIRKCSKYSHVPGPDTKLLLKPVSEAERRPAQSRKRKAPAPQNSFGASVAAAKRGRYPNEQSSLGAAGSSFGAAVAAAARGGIRRQDDNNNNDDVFGAGYDDDDDNGASNNGERPVRGGGTQVRYTGFDANVRPRGRASAPPGHIGGAAAGFGAPVRSVGKRMEPLQKSRINQLEGELDNLQIEYEDLQNKCEDNKKMHADQLKEMAGKHKTLRTKYRKAKEDYSMQCSLNERLYRENEQLKVRNEELEAFVKRLQETIRRREPGNESSDDDDDDDEDSKNGDVGNVPAHSADMV